MGPYFGIIHNQTGKPIYYALHENNIHTALVQLSQDSSKLSPQEIRNRISLIENVYPMVINGISTTGLQKN